MKVSGSYLGGKNKLQRRHRSRSKKIVKRKSQLKGKKTKSRKVKNSSYKGSKTIMVSKTILKKLNDEQYTALTIKELETAIKAADAFYHESDAKGLEIEDEVYDILRDLLVEKAPSSKILGKIGHMVQSGEKEKLQYHLGSQNKLKDDASISRQLKSYPGSHVVSDKMDGISLMVSKKGAFTRGDGDTGRNITPLYQIMESVGKVPPLPKGDEVIRGELIITDNAYQRLAKQFSKKKDVKGSDKFPKNKRSFAAGMANSKTLNKKYIEDLDFVAYEVIEPKMKISQQMKWLQKNGYQVVWHQKLKENEITVNNLSDILSERKDYHKKNGTYEIDGIVLVNNQEHEHPIAGNPAYSFAFKTLNDDQLATTKVKDVQWNATKHGILPPLVIIDPVEIGGTTISKVSGKNARYIVDNKIGPGATVVIERSGDVIPNINKTIKGAKLKLPSVSYHWDKEDPDEGVHFVADEGAASNEIEISLLENFFDKMKASGFGPGIVNKLYEAGYKHPGDVLNMSIEDFESLDGIAEKSANSLFTNLHDSILKATPEMWVAASGAIPGFGKTRIKAILKEIPDLLSNKKRSADTLYHDLVALDGLAEKMARQFVDNMQNFNSFMDNIPSKISKKIKLDASVSKSKVKSKGSVVMSGSRDKSVIAHLESKGYELSNSVKADTLYLIVSDKSSTSSKVKAAEKKNIPIIDLVAAMKL
jgi:NAD-dependent DNA ligase